MAVGCVRIRVLDFHSYSIRDKVLASFDSCMLQIRVSQIEFNSGEFERRIGSESWIQGLKGQEMC